MIGFTFTFHNDAGDASRWVIWDERDNVSGRRYLAMTIACKNKDGLGYWSIFKRSEMEDVSSLLL